MQGPGSWCELSSRWDEPDSVDMTVIVSDSQLTSAGSADNQSTSEAPSIEQVSDNQSTSAGSSESSDSLDQNSDELAFPCVVRGTSRDGSLSKRADGFTAFAGGTEVHAKGRCWPCIFMFSRRGCVAGKHCRFCHHADHADQAQEVKQEPVSASCQPAAYPQRVARVLQSSILSPNLKLWLCQQIYCEIFESAVMGEFMEDVDTEPCQPGWHKISL